ncbi:RDD family protein [Demequina lutea]|uniref:Putative RDD family membrane protein YckC n=1 Tax=Demequina lutea TaxID=431489 RepID=A0A7Y9Z8Y1_9MICO|nr:RDD family protein [Demequina lutea]NYI40791.1 putative RDD family membrane protein YckC [Demequina lutea]
MATGDETIIGEGVALDTAAASLGSRAASALLDALVLGAVYFVATIVMAIVVPHTLDFAAVTTLYFTEALAVFVGIPVVFETLTRGKSVGRYALGLRIVRDDGGPIAVRQVVVRALVGVIELWLTAGSIALIASASNSRGKRVGDMLAGTYALQTRAASAQHLPLTVPFSLSGWARVVDIRRLPDGLALEARQFLTRALALHPSSRRHMGESLSARIAPHVSPLPPEGTHPETFLTAVLAVRRDREYALEMRQLQADSAQALAVHQLPHGVPDVAN